MFFSNVKLSELFFANMIPDDAMGLLIDRIKMRGGFSCGLISRVDAVCLCDSIWCVKLLFFY